MTTYTANQFVAASASPLTGFADSARNVKIVETFIDLALTSGLGSVNAGAGLASGDVVKMISMPIGAFVLGAGMEILTAFDTSVTIAVGDSGSSTRFLAQTAATSTGIKGATPAATQFYAAIDDLRITTGGATATVGKVRVWAVIAEVTKHLPATTAVL